MRFADPNLLFLVVLFLHIGGAIVAFGPTFAFPLIGAMGGREPQHANFAIRASELVAKRLVTPLAIFQGVTGVALIALRGWPVTQLWLAGGIVLYLIALVYAFTVTTPTGARLIEATSGPPPAPPAGGPPPSGPPPHVAELVRRVQRNGIIQTVLLVAIVVLMVFKPTI